MTEKKTVFIRIHPAKKYGMWLDGFHYVVQVIKPGSNTSVVSAKTYVSETGALNAAKRFLNDLDQW